MLPADLLPWLREHLLHSSANGAEHTERMEAVDALLEAQKRQRAEYRRRVAAAERKYRGYTKP